MIVFVDKKIEVFKGKIEFWKTWHICHREVDNFPIPNDFSNDVTGL